MPTFKYKAKKGPDEITEGFVEAAHQHIAVNKVIQLGLTPIDVILSEVSTNKQASKSRMKPAVSLLKRISRNDISLFTRQISDLVDASVPILRSLQIVSRQTKNPHFKSRIDAMYNFVKDGGSFSLALAQHADIFSTLYINMVKTGEVGGQQEKVLTRLADFLEKEQESHSKIKSSLAYPALILAVGFLTIFVLLTFVIPRLSIMFDDLGQELPLPTIILMNVSWFFSKYWWLMISFFIVSGIYFKKWVNSPTGRVQFDQFKLKIPFFGHFTKIVEVSRFSRTLGTLVENGVAITTALNSVWAIIENRVLQEEVKQISQDVTNGSSLNEALRKGTFFPEMAMNMISVGEETGRLDRGLYKIADNLEREVDETVKTMISLLGPLVLVVIVTIVGFVVIAMLLPIFQMNLLIQ